jgi:hypothetical protein
MGVATPEAGRADSREGIPSVCHAFPTSLFTHGAAPGPPEGGTPNTVDAQKQTCETNPIGPGGGNRPAKQSQCKRCRAQRVIRTKRTQLAPAGCANEANRAEDIVRNEANWHTLGSLLRTVWEGSPARLDGRCIRTNNANWMGSEPAFVRNKANCRGAQMGDNCLIQQRLRWFWPVCSRWRTKPICRGRRGARHPVSPGREPR